MFFPQTQLFLNEHYYLHRKHQYSANERHSAFIFEKNCETICFGFNLTWNTGYASYMWYRNAERKFRNPRQIFKGKKFVVKVRCCQNTHRRNKSWNYLSGTVMNWKVLLFFGKIFILKDCLNFSFKSLVLLVSLKLINSMEIKSRNWCKSKKKIDASVGHVSLKISKLKKWHICNSDDTILLDLFTLNFATSSFCDEIFLEIADKTLRVICLNHK